MSEELRHALVHLTGPHRGATRVLDDEVLTIGTDSEAEVRFPPVGEPGVAARHARILRKEAGWHLEVAAEAAVFVNGEERSSTRLLPGDVLQVGPDGPLLRLRLEPASGSEYKSLRDALADCVACARYGADSVPARAGLLLEAMPGELLTQTSPAVRSTMIGAVLLGLAATAYQIVQSEQLEDRLTRTRGRLRAVAASLRAEQRRQTVTASLLDSVQQAARKRREAAGQASGRADPAGPAVLTDAAGSVVLIQGAYGFEDPETGRPLRFRPDARRPRSIGDPLPVAPNADGPPLERRFTGTAFAVTGRGHFVTSRHLVRPWTHDRVARSLQQSGYRPVFRRLTGYLPGREEPVRLKVVAESDSADVALLRAPGLRDPPAPLRLGGEPPAVGASVYLLGYPTGLRALLVRSDPQFVASLERDSVNLDPWAVTERLAAEGRISPLTTRGIVGQVTSSAVVYDAQTTHGGSGGPVLGPEGRVVAVNRGVMPEFGGSNLGVPVRHVRRLLERVGAETP